jgi:hypothetical protein
VEDMWRLEGVGIVTRYAARLLNTVASYANATVVTGNSIIYVKIGLSDTLSLQEE